MVSEGKHAGRSQPLATRFRIALAVVVLTLLLGSQALGADLALTDMIHGATTLVTSQSKFGEAQATGFFCSRQGPPPDPRKQFQWVPIKGIWLIVNRHAIFRKVNGVEIEPEQITFNVRKEVNGRLEWSPVSFSKDEVFKRTLFHPDKRVDVAIISVFDTLEEHFGGSKISLTITSGLRPRPEHVTVEVGDEVLIIGYPKGFYDQANLFPVVKSGIISSKWGADFGGLPHFMIDAKLFPGSSGSLVISKPTNYKIVDGKPLFSKLKKYAFLGIFSGEPERYRSPIQFPEFALVPRDTWDLGIVWYGGLIEYIIDQGKRYQPGVATH